MPRWLPDSFDAIAHNARVRSMRSALREQDAAHRVVIGNGGERVATDHITGGGVDGASPGSPMSDTKSGPPTHQRSGPSASPGSSSTLLPAVPAAPVTAPTADHSLPTARGRGLSMPEPLERDIQAAILAYLRVHPRVVWAARMNTGMAEYRAPDGRTRRVRFAFTGCPDILGQMRDGRLLALEVKRPSGRITEDQLAFLGRAARHNALAFIARSVDDVRLALDVVA